VGRRPGERRGRRGRRRGWDAARGDGGRDEEREAVAEGEEEGGKEERGGEGLESRGGVLDLVFFSHTLSWRLVSGMLDILACAHCLSAVLARSVAIVFCFVRFSPYLALREGLPIYSEGDKNPAHVVCGTARGAVVHTLFAVGRFYLSFHSCRPCAVCSRVLNRCQSDTCL